MIDGNISQNQLTDSKNHIIMELKALIVILIIVFIIYNVETYKPVYSKTFGMGAPSTKSIVLFLITKGLFIFGLYLNEYPIYIF